MIALKPDQPNAYNALGYSLADRGTRLPESRELIARALALAPDDPFITDSLGWVEFKLGRTDEALRLLRAAFKSRPDTEIAAHLGEVLWATGKLDEAQVEALVSALGRQKVNLIAVPGAIDLGRLRRSVLQAAGWAALLGAVFFVPFFFGWRGILSATAIPM